MLYPSGLSCPLCRREEPVEGLLCGACQLRLEVWREEPRCRCCGRPGPGEGKLCRDCRESTPPFRLARAAAPYDGPFRQAVHRLKFQGELWLAEPLGLLMAETVSGEAGYGGTELVVPVPLHPGKLKARGYNQSSLLGEVLSRKLLLPLGDRLLVKERETRDQTGLTRKERWENLKGAFRVDKPQQVRGKSVLLVDDILTTGSTVTHCAGTLLAAGAAEVTVITWAVGSNR